MAMTLIDDHRVILEVQRHPILYDPANPFYKDNMRKELAWNEVAAVLKADPSDCKARWRMLRDSFVKYQKKIATANLPPGTAPRDWKYTTSMAFILPFIQNRAPKRRFQPSSDPDCDRSGRPSYQNPSPCPALPALPALSAGPSSASPVPVWTAPVEEDKPSMTDGDREELYHFAMSTVPQLLRLAKRTRRRAKLEILQTLDRLEEEDESLAAAKRYLCPTATQVFRPETTAAGVQIPPPAAVRAPAAVQVECASPQPSVRPDPDSADVKEEPQEQISTVCVKTEVAALLQRRRTERQQQTQAEDVSSEPQFLSEAEAQSSETDNDEDWEPM